MITQKELKEILAYDAGTGDFTWIVSPSNRVKIGSSAGSDTGTGYLRIRISGKDYKAHRLAFLFVEGCLPKDQVDHINRVRNDNRWMNLRHATAAENSTNKSENASNAKAKGGIFWLSKRKRWQARIRIAGRVVHLGAFRTKESAKEIYHMASIELGHVCLAEMQSTSKHRPATFSPQTPIEQPTKRGRK